MCVKWLAYKIMILVNVDSMIIFLQHDLQLMQETSLCLFHCHERVLADQLQAQPALPRMHKHQFYMSFAVHAQTLQKSR